MTKLNYNFDIGIAAISWVNDDIPGLGDDTPLDDVLKEMNELGYIATEKGRTLPDNQDELKSILSKHHLTLASQFVSVKFSDASLHNEEIAKFKKQAQFLKEMDCDYVIVCEMAGSMHWDPRVSNHKDIHRLDDSGWNALVKGLHEAGAYCNELGLELVYHPHAGTVIEQKEEVDKLMSMTDTQYINLLYDTGHALYGNYNPYELLENYMDRIKYVHYKDVRLDVLKQCRIEGKNFREEVLEGIFTVPGDGVIDFKPIMKKLMQSGYKGWVIVEAEQDPEKANPYQYAKKAIEYLHETEEQIKEELSKANGGIHL